DEINDELINEIRNNGKVLTYLDIPIQHASDRILKAMGRRGSASRITELIEKLRNRIPGIILRTSLIVGFPGEDEKDFEILYNFVESQKFDRLGVFEYSREEDTPAANFSGQVPEKLKAERKRKIMRLQNEISRELNSRRVGKTYKTMVEGVSEDGIFYYGRTYAESPDIDGVVYFTSPEPLNAGTFVNVKILNTEDY